MKEIIIAIISSGVLSTLISAIFSAANEKKRQSEGEKNLVLFLVACTLDDMAEKSLERGKIKNEKLKLFNDLLKLYKAKGGNGYIDLLAQKVAQLPIDFN